MARVSAKGQVTLPKKIREVLKIEPGTTVTFMRDNGGVRLQVETTYRAANLAGVFKKYAKKAKPAIVRKKVKAVVGHAAANEGFTD